MQKAGDKGRRKQAAKEKERKSPKHSVSPPADNVICPAAPPPCECRETGITEWEQTGGQWGCAERSRGNPRQTEHDTAHDRSEPVKACQAASKELGWASCDVHVCMRECVCVYSVSTFLSCTLSFLFLSSPIHSPPLLSPLLSSPFLCGVTSILPH